MEESLSKFMAESAKRHEENSNLIKEIQASTDSAIRNQGASIKALEIQIEQMSKVLQEMGSRNLPSSTEINPRDHVKSISTTVETDTTAIRHIGSTRYVVSAPQNKEGSYGLKDLDAYSIRTTLLDDALPTKEKDPGSFTFPWLRELAPTKLIVELADRTVKLPKGKVENVLVRINKFVFLVDFIILDIPEDIKTPLILGRPFLSTTHSKIDVFKRKITLRVGNNKLVFKSDKPASNIIKRVYVLSLKEMMELDLEARLMGEVLILNRSLDPFYGYYIKLNDLNDPLELRRNRVDDLEPTIDKGEVLDEPMIDIVKTRCDNEIVDGLDEFNNSIIKENFEYKGKNVVGAFMNVPIFVGNFSTVAYFALVENMDAYRDDGIGDIIAGRPFCSHAYVKTRRFKHLTNAQCNKIPPLLIVSTQDELKGILHPYRKLKGFYKEVLNLGLEYIKNEKVEEWLTYGHMSIHEME
ncbi:reverse transcriptase domain-containing protein [Tanacetum coccineum]